MKTLLVLALLFVGVGSASVAHGQPGIKAGVTLTRYTNTNTPDIKQLVGGQVGVTYAFPLVADGFLSLQPELLYNQKGAKVIEQGANITSRLHYLDLPVLARLKAGALIVEAGPQLGYLLSQSGDYKNNAPEATYNKVDFGYVAGVGYQAEQGYNVGVRYNGGLSKLFDFSAGTAGIPRNVSFQLYVGYVFNSN